MADRHLDPEHRRALEQSSGIHEDIIRERGYFSAVSMQESMRLGFAAGQARPGLVLPIYGLGGSEAGRQLRPDTPREKDGKFVKYETPKGARAVPDIHPRMQPMLGEWGVQLWITEGIKKGDAAASRGLTCIALTGGVWGFRNKSGIHTELKDLVVWRGPDGQGRDVVIAFDSDVVAKRGVYDAAQRLAANLESMGARPHFLLLPPGKDGKKQGLDDYFASGGTVHHLQQLIHPKLPPCEEGAGEHDYSEGGGSMADQVVALVRKNPDIELFHAPGDQEHGYATVHEAGRAMNYDIEGSGFKAWLTKAYLEAHDRAPSNDALASAVNTLKALAIHRGGMHAVALRSGLHGSDWYLDIGDEDWQAVHVTSGEWSLTRRPPVRFVRAAAMRGLPTPIRGGTIEGLWSLVNIPDSSHRILFVCWLVAALCPSGPYPILMLHGQQGSAKSFTTSIARRLVDPNEVNLRRPPRNEEDLMVSAGSNHVLALENLSTLPEWMSDAFCAVSTGSGFATRQLYTNKGESVIQACRPIILNGIPALGNRGDFLERCISLELPPISGEQRKSKEQLEREFVTLQPVILGALLDIAAKVLELLHSITLAVMPRMADFARLGVAVERACGWLEGSFLKAYAENVTGMSMLALESGLGGLLVPLVEAELARRELSPVWSVSMKELLRRLRDSVHEDRERRWLPTTERSLRSGLDRLAPSLLSVGVRVTFPERTREGARVRFERASEVRNGLPAATFKLRSEQEQLSAGAPTGGISEFLCLLQRRGVMVRLGTDTLFLEVSGELTEALRTEVESRRDEILKHLRASPGAHIIDYPDEERLHPHAFQELRIKERVKRRKIAEVTQDGVARMRWFHDVPSARMEVIAKEIEEERCAKSQSRSLEDSG